MENSNVNKLAEKILLLCIEEKATAIELTTAVDKVLVEFLKQGKISKK
ncbi:hypothetical protein [Enterococcus sp. AZ102]